MSKKNVKKLSVIITGLILFAMVGFLGSLNVPQAEASSLNQDMLIFISPQYANNTKIKQAINEYINAVREDIGWNTKIINITPEINDFKKIDETPVHRNDDITNTGSNNNYLQYFLILCVVMTLAGLAYRANNVVLPAYLEFKADFLWKLFQNIDFTNIEGTKTMAATLLASFIYMVGIFGQLAGGKLADKYDLRRLYLIFHGLSLPFLIFMGILSEQLLVISAAIYIFFALGMQPIENSLVAKFTPNRWRSTGYGIKFILTFGVGSTAVYFVGWIKEAWSLNVVYFFSGGIVVLILLCIALLILFSRGITCKNIP